MLRNMLPSVWRRSEEPLRRVEEPFFALQREMNHMFDDLFGDLDLMPIGDRESMKAFTPSIDIREGEKEVSVKAELPGIDEKDVEVIVSDGCMTIRGEKKEEKEDRKEGYWHREVHYGAFDRSISLPDGLDSDKAAASFKNGVLDVTVPWLDGAKKKTKKIDIKTH